MQRRRVYQERVGLAQSSPIPAPLKGLNTREGYTDLKPDEARVLENFLPDLGGCAVRPGHTLHCNLPPLYTADSTKITADTTKVTADGAGSILQNTASLIAMETYVSPSGFALIGAYGGQLADVTGSVPVVYSPSPRYQSDKWLMRYFNGYLFGVNGVDTPWRYDGATYGATGFSGSGLTLTTLNTVELVKGRLWFTQNNSADVWYGPLAGVTGTLTKFQLSQIAQGGKCVGVGGWSREGGDGLNDFTVFIMNTGEVIIYTGDPATTFTKVGAFRAPEPIGLRPTCSIGGELIILTENGPVPVSFIVRGVAFDLTELAVWGKIAPAWHADYLINGSTYGWFAHYANGRLYCNVPSNGTSKQYVLNTRAEAWTVYTGLPVASMAHIDSNVYFGSNVDGNVYQHTGSTDNGAAISALARSAFSFPMGQNRSSLFTLLRPKFTTNGVAQMQVQVDVDFNSAEITAPLTTLVSVTSGAAWGAAWGSGWAGTPKTQEVFLSIQGYGTAVAPVIRTYSNADSLIWYSNDIVATQGGIL